MMVYYTSRACMINPDPRASRTAAQISLPLTLTLSLCCWVLASLASLRFTQAVHTHTDTQIQCRLIRWFDKTVCVCACSNTPLPTKSKPPFSLSLSFACGCGRKWGVVTATTLISYKSARALPERQTIHIQSMFYVHAYAMMSIIGNPCTRQQQQQQHSSDDLCCARVIFGAARFTARRVRHARTLLCIACVHQYIASSVV